MDQGAFGLLLGTISSILNCTSKKIEAGRIRIHLDGMCSPFVSHRGVRYEQTGQAEPWPGYLFSGNRQLYVGCPPAGVASRQDLLRILDPEGCCYLVQEEVAKGLVEPLLEVAERYLFGRESWSGNLGELAWVIFPRRIVVRWEEGEGGVKPVFAEPGYAMAEARRKLDELPLSVVSDEKGHYGTLTDRRERFPSIPVGQGGGFSVQHFSCSEELARQWVGLHLEARSVVNSVGQILPPWEGYHVWGKLADLVH